MALSLSKLIKATENDQGEWFRYLETTFEVKLVFYSRKMMQDLWDSSKVRKPDSRNPRTFTEEMDTEKFRKTFAPKMIKDWRGLTIKVLSSLAVLDYPEGVDENEEVPYSEQDSIELVNKSITFDNWVTAMIADVDSFNRAKKEAAIKNSSTAPVMN